MITPTSAEKSHPNPDVPARDIFENLEAVGELQDVGDNTNVGGEKGFDCNYLQTKLFVRRGSWCFSYCLLQAPSHAIRTPKHAALAYKQFYKFMALMASFITRGSKFDPPHFDPLHF